MRFRKGVCLIAALVCLCLLVCGCDQVQPAQTTEPTQTTIAKYTVTFLAAGEEIARQEVEAGSCPTAREPQITGMKFYGWRDEKGAYAQPETVAVYGNTTYTAELHADLSAHEPYLFADKNRFLRPDDLLTAEELTVAINMLAVPGAESYIPELPAGMEAVSVQALKELVMQLFPKETAEGAISTLDGETLTRGEFAAVMNYLLGRTEETASIAENAMLPYDLSSSMEDFPALAEAFFHHAHGEGAASWSDGVSSMKNPQGLMNADGWLYYVDENGELLRDAQLGELTFGPDGRYTCGDPELDATVAEILAEIIANNPGAERIDLLRRAFEYSRDSFSYLRRSAYYFGQTGWEIEDAKKMFETKRGNCYSYAATFWALGRGLGYETIAISGTMTGTDQPHSWVEIYFDGVPYVFDPEMEMVYRFERDIFDKDMFMVDYEAGKYWNYKRP